MKLSLESVLDRVVKRVVPTPQERETMDHLSRQLRNEVDSILEKAGIKADVSIQGSVARDTWLRGEADLDIFARFPTEMDRRDWTERFLPAVHQRLSRYRMVERYAEHPYLEFHVNGVRVNVVPCYNVEKGKWKSATDRTPYHTEYMNSHLTSELRLEARVLKKFMKGIRVYGAEIRIGGFSGMLTETLILNFRSFIETLKETARWGSEVVIDVERRHQEAEELTRKFGSAFVVVDPVDPDRNLAAAVREDRLWSFVAAGREFLKRPLIKFFYPPDPKPVTKNQLAERLRGFGHDIVAVAFSHSPMVPDVLWGQLLRLEKALLSLMERHEFEVLHSSVWSDDKHFSIFMFEVDRALLPEARLHGGPPVWRESDSNAFLDQHLGQRNTLSGPWLGKGRWFVEKRREARSISQLVKRAAREGSLGLTVPSLLEDGFHRTVKVLVNAEALPLLRADGPKQAFEDFLDGRPIWLRAVRS